MRQKFLMLTKILIMKLVKKDVLCESELVFDNPKSAIVG